MRILILHCSYQFKGGEDTVVDEEIKLLTSVGHEVELLLFSNTGNELFKVLQLPFNVGSYRKTVSAIKRFRPHVVHIHNLHFAASPSVIYAIRKCKVPFVNTLHNYRLLCPSGTLFHQDTLFLDSLKQDFPWSAVKKGVYKNSVLLTFWLAFSMKLHHWLGTWKLCNRYIVLTDYAQKILLESNLRLQKDQVTIKPNFCAAAKVSNAAFSDHFLYIGRLSVEKGIRLLLNTFSTLPHEIRIAGDGPLKNEVIEFSRRFSNIKFLGSLDKNEVYQQLQLSSALVFPSIWFEGMPLIIIEAFSSGTPVIASKLGAMGSMIIPNYNGLHFEAENDKELARKINEWIALSEEEKQTLRKNAIATYNEFYSLKTNAQQLMTI